MKRNLSLLMLFASCAVHAGAMGPVTTSPTLQSFVSVEGGYTWNQVNGIRIDVSDAGDMTTIFTDQHDQGGTARVAVGMLNPINDLFLLSGEIGWGYYGNIKQKPKGVQTFNDETDFTPDFDLSSLSGINIKSTQDGFDVLAGLIYNQPRYDLFFKAGALIQNSVTQVDVDFTLLSANLAGEADVKINQTQALPEIKLGGAYHINDKLSVLASWSHAFGAKKKINISLNPDASFGQIDINLQNPTLDVALVGLQYRFA